MAGPDDRFSDPTQLAAVIRRDRIDRGLTWPAYAEWIGVKLSTIYKIAKGGTKRPNELTIDKIQKRLAAAGPAAAAEGGSSEVVSGGQRHPERSED